MLDFRVDTFMAVCRNMNYTKAASELNITQPAVSQHIKYLEGLYHTKLFTYQNKKIALTDSGRLLYEAAVTMKHDEQFLKKMILEKKEEMPSLCLGVTLTAGEYCISDKLAAYVKMHPNTPIDIKVENTNDLLTKLNEGEIDCAIVEGNFAKREYDYEVFSRQELVPVCAGTHKAFADTPVLLEDLLHEVLIIREAQSGGREILEHTLKERNLKPEDFSNLIQVSSILTIKDLVVRDCGITFLYEEAVVKELREGTLKRIPLKDFHVEHDITFIFRKNSMYAQHYRKIYDLLKS